MTVCIAAFCNVGPNQPPCIVAACDRMITIGEIEYEPEQRKATQLAGLTIGLFAGDMQLHASIVPKSMETVKQSVAERDEKRVTVEEIAQSYASEFALYRSSLAEKEILAPRGLNFERFARQQAMLPHYQVRDLDALIASNTIHASAIVAGLDHTGGHIYQIRDPGVAECMDTPFFACIGSGMNIASTQFMVAKYDKTWPLAKALWLVFSAKARSEVAGGVGYKTDLIVITPGGITYADPEQKDQLYRLFHKVIERENAAQEEAINAIGDALTKGSHGSAGPPAQGTTATGEPTPPTSS